MEEPETSRRERKKQRTRSRMVRSALDLFLERGYDNVTIAEIAEAADVFPTTFFRHFGSKEGVLVTERETVLATFGALIADQPEELPLRAALVAAFSELMDRLDLDPDEERLRAILAKESDAVRAVTLSFVEDVRLTVRDAIASRLRTGKRPDPRPDMIAAVVMAALSWVRGPVLEGKQITKRQVVRLFEQALASVESLADADVVDRVAVSASQDRSATPVRASGGPGEPPRRARGRTAREAGG